MNNQITRRNLLKLLGVSGVTLPLAGINKDLEINSKTLNQEDNVIKLSSNENSYGTAKNLISFTSYTYQTKLRWH
tara:strand:- start:2529 stop:2753 length:225 start_codon:yes stop_codon:yes gene_type:complete